MKKYPSSNHVFIHYNKNHDVIGVFNGEENAKDSVNIFGGYYVLHMIIDHTFFQKAG